MDEFVQDDGEEGEVIQTGVEFVEPDLSEYVNDPEEEEEKFVDDDDEDPPFENLISTKHAPAKTGTRQKATKASAPTLKAGAKKKTLPTTSTRRKGVPSKLNIKAPAIVNGVTKKPHRFRPGTVALREIRKMQKGTNLLIPRLRFSRLVREIAAEMYSGDGGLMFTKPALLALQEDAEAYIVKVFNKTNDIALHSKRITICPNDMKIAVKPPAQ